MTVSNFFENSGEILVNQCRHSAIKEYNFEVITGDNCSPVLLSPAINLSPVSLIPTITEILDKD